MDTNGCFGLIWTDERAVEGDNKREARGTSNDEVSREINARRTGYKSGTRERKRERTDGLMWESSLLHTNFSYTTKTTDKRRS